MKTRYNIIDCSGAFGVQFWIGNQGFMLNYLAEKKEDAEWMIQTLSGALDKLVESAKGEAYENVHRRAYEFFSKTELECEETTGMKAMLEITDSYRRNP